MSVMSSQRIPVLLLTGFLGAGKTTLLKAMLAHRQLARSALVINEVGQIALDHALVGTSAGTPIVLAGGCICCSFRSDIGHTLRDLFIRRTQGTVPPFDRVIIETTGLADPAPLVSTLITDAWLASQFELRAVITLADAVNLIHTLDRHDESVRQIALADRLILTKTDLVRDSQDIEIVRRRIRALNAAAPMTTSNGGEVDPGFLLAPAPERRSATIEAWLDGESSGVHEQSQVSSESIRLPVPLHWSTAARTLDLLFATHGRTLLRVKGVLNVRGSDRPVVVHGVQGTFHPPALLETWPEGPRDSRIVFITHGIDAASVAAEFAAAVSGRAPGALRHLAAQA